MSERERRFQFPSFRMTMTAESRLEPVIRVGGKPRPAPVRGRRLRWRAVQAPAARAASTSSAARGSAFARDVPSLRSIAVEVDDDLRYFAAFRSWHRHVFPRAIESEDVNRMHAWPWQERMGQAVPVGDRAAVA